MHDRRTAKLPGKWSAEAVSLFNTWGGLDFNPGRTASFESPDHQKIVRVDAEDVTIWIEGKRFKTDFRYKTNAELGWAPNSSRFFLTWTDGGETGTWQAQVFDVFKNGLREIRGIAAPARKDFDSLIRKAAIPKEFDTRDGRLSWKQLQYCVPNVVASQWLNDSNELLLSALVPNVSGCRFMSEFRVYRVAVPSGSILQSYSAEEAHQLFNPATLPRIVKRRSK
jgi:hypothetical protein